MDVLQYIIKTGADGKMKQHLTVYKSTQVNNVFDASPCIYGSNLFESMRVIKDSL